MASESRAARVGELIRQEIARLIQDGLKDPRIGFVSVMSVRMSPDLRYATVFVSAFGDDKAKKSSLAALRNSEGWFRKQIGKAIRLRFTPAIRFVEDGTLDTVYQLEDVFKQIHDEQEQREQKSDNDSES